MALFMGFFFVFSRGTNPDPKCIDGHRRHEITLHSTIDESFFSNCLLNLVSIDSFFVEIGLKGKRHGKGKWPKEDVHG